MSRFASAVACLLFAGCTTITPSAKEPAAPSRAAPAPFLPLAPSVDPTKPADFEEAAGDSRLGYRYFSRARSTPREKEEWRVRMTAARDAYVRADAAWTKVLSTTSRPSTEYYQARYWLADARKRAIDVRRAIGETIAPETIESAIVAALAARDSADGNDWIRGAAANVVEMTAVLVIDAKAAYVAGKCATPSAPKVRRVEKKLSGVVFKIATDATSGMSAPPHSSATNLGSSLVSVSGAWEEPGWECWTEAKLKEDEREEVHPIWVRDIEPTQMRWLRACEELVARVPAAHDPEHVFQCRSDIGWTLLDHGWFNEAHVWLDPLWGEACGRHRASVKALGGLVRIAAVEGSGDFHVLVERGLHDCAVNAAGRFDEFMLNATIHRSNYCGLEIEGDRAFANAAKEPDPAKRAQYYVEATAGYRRELERNISKHWIVGSAHALRIALNLAYVAKLSGDPHARKLGLRYVLDHYCSAPQLAKLRAADLETADRALTACPKAGYELGQVCLEHPEIDTMLPVYGYERALQSFEACKLGVGTENCPPDVDIWIGRAKSAHENALAIETTP